MPITFTCPRCGQRYNVPEEHAGRQTKCARCQAVLTVPAAGTAPAPAAGAPAQAPGPSAAASVPGTAPAPTPPAGGAAPAPGGKRALPAALVVVVGLAVLALVVGGALFMRSRQAPPPQPQPTRTAPAGPPAGSTAPAPTAEAPVAPAPSDAVWPGWLGPNRDGKSPDTGLLKQWPQGGPRLLWKTSGIGAGFSSATVSGGRVFTTGIAGGQLQMTALDMDGKQLWQVPIGPDHGNTPGSRSTPTVDGDRVYLISGMGLIGCYDAKSGSKLWTRDMSELGGRVPEWGYAESVLIHNDLAIVTPGGAGCIAALNKQSGQTVWQSKGFDAPAHYGSCIAVDFGGVPMIVAGTGGGIFGVSARDGSLLWQNDFSAGNTANCPTPAYADGHVFWANGYGKGGICLKLAAAGGSVTAQPAWQTRDMDCHHGGYVILDGSIYGNNGAGWTCLDLKTGAKKWSAQGVGKGSLCYADGMLYLFGENGGQMGLATCSPAGLEMRGTFNVAGSGASWAHPVVIGGRLYVRYDDNLYCYYVKS